MTRNYRQILHNFRFCFFHYDDKILKYTPLLYVWRLIAILYSSDIGGKVMNETFFREILSAFLFSPSGSRFQTFFHFNGNLTIGKPTPQLLVGVNSSHVSRFLVINCILITYDLLVLVRIWNLLMIMVMRHFNINK